MRERFSEINIVGNSTPIPVGAEAKNITLKDGSILEQALGDINFQVLIQIHVLKILQQ